MSRVRNCHLPVLAFAALCAALPHSLRAQDRRPVAFTNARIVTVAGPVIEQGTLVIRKGKIEAVGADATVPAGAKIVDAEGKTIMPGLVSAYSRAGLSGGQPDLVQRSSRRGRGFPRGVTMRSSGSRAANKAATRVVDGLYPKQKVFHELLEAGVTSLALTPTGNAFPGTGAVLAPNGTTVRELTADGEAFLQIGMARDAATKKLLKDSFDKAKKVVEERNKPKEEPKPAQEPEAKKPAEKNGDKPAEKAGEKKGDTKEPPKPGPKPTPKPTPTPKPEGKEPPKQPTRRPTTRQQKKDPNIEVLADLLEGKKRAIVEIGSAADLAHWQNAIDAELEFPRTLVSTRHDPYSGTLDIVLDEVKKLDCPVLLPAALSTKGRSRHLTHPARTLHDAGVEVGFVIGDNSSSARSVFFRLMELVRSGLPQDVAYAGVTRVPAKALGIDESVGTLEVGKDANLIVFTGDPLSPASEIDSVWFRGHAVERKQP